MHIGVGYVLTCAHVVADDDHLGRNGTDSSLRLEPAKRLGVVVLWSNEGDKIALLSSSGAKDLPAKVYGCVLELAEIADVQQSRPAKCSVNRSERQIRARRVFLNRGSQVRALPGSPIKSKF